MVFIGQPIGIRLDVFSPPRSLLENIEGELWREVDAINKEYREMAISPTLQGLGKKIAQFKHDVEFEAAKISTEVDTMRADTLSTFSGVDNVLAAHKKDLEDVKSFVAEVAQATNGGPALDSPAPAAATSGTAGAVTPGPYPTYP